MNVIKRSGEEVSFDSSRIRNAVQKASDATPSESVSETDLDRLTTAVEQKCERLKRAVSVEEIQDMVEAQIMALGYLEIARKYIAYRYKRQLVRKSNTTDQQIMSLLRFENEEVKQENSNKNPLVNSVQRDYMAGEVSKDITKRFLLPADVVEAHEQGMIHFHDADYFAQNMTNCCLVNLEDMLQNGTVVSETLIEKPHSFSTACNIATQIIAQVASSQYGGQTITLAHLSPFIDVSRRQIRREVEEELCGLYEIEPVDSYDSDLEFGAVSDERIEEIVEKRLKKEIRKGVQTLQYQIITLMTTNGQAPFVSVCMDLEEVPEGQARDDLAMLIEEVLIQRIEGVKNEKGVFITPAFPKLLYVLEESNIHEDAPYFYLTELAAACTAKRMVPDYISKKIMTQLKIDQNGNGQCYPCMGCRSFLTPYVDSKGQPKYYGRFNQGVVTINLVDAACSSGGDEKAFWKIMEERTDLCYRALMERHRKLEGTTSDVAPILWQHGAYARLKRGETIDRLLHGGYSTISLGYAGLCECVKYMKGVSHTTEEGAEFGKRVMQYLNDRCAEWKAKENVDFSLYGTPMESTTYKFAKKLQERFGIIPGVTDKTYITNSYHVHVAEEIDAFTKLTKEAEFQKLSPGGAISYVEVPDLKNNLDAVLALIRHIYETILYAELNTKSDYCQKCGYDGEIQIVENSDGKLIWECPNCGNRNQETMNIARRVCGYISTHGFNQGRTQEIKDRILHL